MRFCRHVLVAAAAIISALITVPAVGVSAATGVPAPSAAPSAAPKVPITSLHQMVADTAHGHLFFTQGAFGIRVAGRRNYIVVTDLAGKLITKITTGQGAVTGMALSPDGSTLYAALTTDHAVSAISTTTLRQTARYPTGAGVDPYAVAVQVGKVWVSYQNSQNPPAFYLGVINPADPPASAFTGKLLSMGFGFLGPAELAADPSDDGWLVAWNMSRQIVDSLDVATSPVTVYPAQPSALLNHFCETAWDVAVLPGGAQFVVACGRYQLFDTKTYAYRGQYLAGGGTLAVGVSAAGTVATASRQVPNIVIFGAGTKTPVNKFWTNTSQMIPAFAGLAWALDGSALFVLYQTFTSTNKGPVFTVRSWRDPAITVSTIALGGATTAIHGRSFTVTGTLSLTVGTLPAGTQVIITRTRAGGGPAGHWTVTPSASGTFSITDTLNTLGTYTYSASYAGATGIAPATATRQVTITLIPPSLSVTTSRGGVLYGSTVTVTAHLGKTFTNRTLSIYALPYGSTKQILLRTGRADSHGNLSVSYAPARKTTFIAVFGGDAKYEAATATRVVYVQVAVSQLLSGYYTTEYIGGTLYLVYHHTATLTAAAAVAPHKSGGCVTFEVQGHSQGSWQPNTSSPCVALNGSSRASAPFKFTGPTGGLFRIRADYTHARTDQGNTNGDSAWAYFTDVT
jgi:hypothetical protein